MVHFLVLKWLLLAATSSFPEVQSTFWMTGVYAMQSNFLSFSRIHCKRTQGAFSEDDMMLVLMLETLGSKTSNHGHRLIIT